MKEQPTQPTASKQEASVIRTFFKGNDELLKTLRALFLGLGVTEGEKEIIKNTFANDELRAIMWRRFYPTIDRLSPVGQVQDVWMGAEQMVFGQAPTTIQQAIQYKARAIDMTKLALELLTNPDGERIDISFVPQIVDELGINLLARNQFIRHVESQLLVLKTIAEIEEESDEDVVKRQLKDSSE